MSSVEHLREFVNERLTAAAEEIFGVFKRALVEYEQIYRQSKMSDVVRNPEMRLHRIESPQQTVCKDEETFTEQQLCNLERNSDLDREDPEPPQSHEQKELCSPQEGEQPVLKQETHNLMLTAVDEEKEHSEDQTLDLHPYQNVEKHVFSISVISSVVSEPNSDPHQLSDSSDIAEVKDQEEDEHQGPRSTRNKKPRHSNSDNEHNILKARCNTHKGKKSFRCDTCCKDFKYKSLFLRHMRSHTGEKPYPCGICGRMFGHMSTLKSHLRVHTGEKPYICISCGTKFRQSCHLLVHIKKHHGSEKPFSCQLCEKGFVNRSELRVHMRSHSAERPFSCVQCGRTFKRRSHASVHVKRAHTCEKPFLCKICLEVIIQNVGALWAPEWSGGVHCTGRCQSPQMSNLTSCNDVTEVSLQAQRWHTSLKSSL